MKETRVMRKNSESVGGRTKNTQTTRKITELARTGSEGIEKHQVRERERDLEGVRVRIAFNQILSFSPTPSPSSKMLLESIFCSSSRFKLLDSPRFRSDHDYLF
jgi:hypothetical protein